MVFGSGATTRFVEVDNEGNVVGSNTGEYVDHPRSVEFELVAAMGIGEQNGFNPLVIEDTPATEVGNRLCTFLVAPTDFDRNAVAEGELAGLGG